MNYYVADDNPKWQKKLAEYGLIQSEWRMMEKLNSEEGGLSKFFGDFKTSDHLVDRLLIPTIESKLNQTHNKEDNSLATMLLTYAKSQTLLLPRKTLMRLVRVQFLSTFYQALLYPNRIFFARTCIQLMVI